MNEALKAYLDENNIGGGYNKMRLVDFSKEFTNVIVKLIDWLDKKGGVCGEYIDNS